VSKGSRKKLPAMDDSIDGEEVGDVEREEGGADGGEGAGLPGAMP